MYIDSQRCEAMCRAADVEEVGARAYVAEVEGVVYT